MTALTYPEVGRTSGELPAGYRHVRRTVVIGSGRLAFAAAARSLLRWDVQRRAGLHVAASAPAVEPDADVCLSWGVGPFRYTAPCRVVYVISEPRRQGFAYGTLPGHPESGEEAFILEHRDDDAVTFTVIAFSRPATLLAKAAGPVGHAAQDFMTRRYLRALTAR